VLPRLLATDLDGTLLRDDGTVSPRTRRALHAIQDAGTEVVIATARPVRWIQELAQETGVTGTAVCANGAVIWDLAADALVHRFPVDPAAAREVVARLDLIVPGGAWAVESVDSFSHEPGYEVRWPVPDDTVVDHIEGLLVNPVVKLSCTARSRERQMARTGHVQRSATLLSSPGLSPPPSCLR
jgi:hydroxymethylpyrimidine pyrophosphatase-like HAD family hydrolase